jgi:predicted acyl esterase
MMVKFAGRGAHRLRTLVVAGCLLALACPAPAGQEHLVPMSDGVRLVTDVFLPEEGGPSWPVVLERSPYPRPQNDQGWNRLGIAYVVQSVRGRFGSEGTFRPFADEGWGEHTDGADTVRWILEQPWCNGKVGTYGGSATGLTSALLGPATDKLSFQIIQEAAGNFRKHLAYEGGVLHKALVEGWLEFGVQAPEYAQVWKDQPPSSPYWDYYDADALAERINAPGLHVGGWWDIFGNATVEMFLRRQHHGGPGAKGNQKLIMRPAGHGPWGRQDLKFPPNFDEFRITPYRKRLAQYWFTGVDDGVAGDPAVRYYTVGDDRFFDGPGWEWRTADDWPPFPNPPTPYYLRADGTLDTQAPDDASASRTYAFDPANPVPTRGGQNLTIDYGPYDQRPVSSRPDVLAFVTAPVEAPLETTGHFLVELYVASDAPDTDFTAKLVDVYPPDDGREILMLDSIVRARYRNCLTQPAPPLTPGEVVKVTIDLGHISWIFNTGHRIGLQISSSNYPRFEVNPNNGRELPNADVPSRVANNTVFFDRDRPSRILLPVRKGE